MIPVQDDGQIDVSEPVHVAGPTEGIADDSENFYEENANNEEEMQGEPLYIVEELD